MSLRPIVPAAGTGARPLGRVRRNARGAENPTAEARGAEVLLLENIRFHPGEEANDPAFAARLAGLGDVYCNDAFSAAHRAHASTEGVARHLPACAGRLMQAELEALEAALGTPRPVMAVVGGAKVSTKLDLWATCRPGSTTGDRRRHGQYLSRRPGHRRGQSLCEHDMADTAREIMAKARTRAANFCCPPTWSSPANSPPGPHETVPATECPPRMR